LAHDLTLSIDVGTGSVRAALVDRKGEILHIAAREHDQIVPQFGWTEQRPLDWWAGVVASIHATLAALEGARERIAAVCACGQMHGTVLVDGAGRPTRETAPLWNDKRTAAIVAGFEREYGAAAYLSESGNPPRRPGLASNSCGCATMIRRPTPQRTLSLCPRISSIFA
jgi:xylulokinase